MTAGRTEHAGRPIRGWRRVTSHSAGLFFCACLAASLYAGQYVPATWMVERVALDVRTDDAGRSYVTFEGDRRELEGIGSISGSELRPAEVERLNASGDRPAVERDVVYEEKQVGGKAERSYYGLTAKHHWRMWSLLPAVAAIGLCWLTREPIPSLLGGVVTGALLLGQYDLLDEALIPRLATTDAATILVLYLWLLGGLMGVWSRTGAAQAFAEFMTRRFVRGPRSAKLVAWSLGVLFFQGGSISTVLVGTTVKPVADKERISHEELSYIVDSTASPVASLLAFNAWPGYVQAFIFVAGVPWLATESDRIQFFFKAIPLCFYAIFAVAFTFLLSLGWMPFVGGRLQAAMKRSRETGELDGPEAEPLSARELQASDVPEGYRPHVADFLAPLGLLIAVAVGTFVASGSPRVTWAFGAAILLACLMAIARGMRLKALVEGCVRGLKGVVMGSVILLLAVTIGSISRETGGGSYLVELIGERWPYWLLPVSMQVMTMIIAFSTGTSWGTYAVTFPLAMPLAWAVANSQGLEHPQLFMALCFAAVMDGSVYGDQCSPISDTTVLSSMATGCDLMDHVRTQMPQASVAALIAAVLWTVITLVAV